MEVEYMTTNEVAELCRTSPETVRFWRDMGNGPADEAARLGVAMEVEYMTTKEVAELCRTSPETVRFWRHVGKGPTSFKCGRRVLYPKTEVQLWLTGLRAQEAQRV